MQLIVLYNRESMHTRVLHIKIDIKLTKSKKIRCKMKRTNKKNIRNQIHLKKA